MKSYPHCSRSLCATVFVGSCLALICASNLPAQTPKVGPATHAAHVAAGTMPAAPVPDAAKGDPALTQQLAQMQAKVAQLEAALAKNAPQQTTAGGMPGMGGPPSGAGPAMAGMGGGAMPPAPAAAMGGGGMAMGMDMMKMGGMMGMMDKMMGMMDKMMPMGGGAMPAAAPMPAGGGMGMMDMDMMKMGGGGAMPAAAPAAPMSGGGMGMMTMDKMEMAGMMGMGGMGGAAPGAMPQSALPGFPGASHLYHLGATGFFLDHTQHIALTTEQQAGLNKAKEQALLAKSTADRAKEQAEQELWMLTAADQPDAMKIEAKLAEISKLTANERFAFIRAVGEASKLLTDPQRQSLTGFAPPAPAAPAAAPMKDM